MTPPIALVATLLERAFGYPPALMPVVSHPVVWMGAAIGWADQRFNQPQWPPARRRRAGIAVLLVLCLGSLAMATAISVLLANLPLGWIIEAMLASTLIAQSHLARSVADVAAALGGSLQAGRKAVSNIVGRDTADLDEDGVVRGALESLAENTSDGVVAPVIYLALFGLPGIVLYKLVNTADSMIGHKSPRHRKFGWAAARLDDVLNFVPARLTALLFAAAARLLRLKNASKAWAAARRDAPAHRSPNAGWPEAAMAEALGLSLGGPRNYAGKRNDLPFMGAGRTMLDVTDIAPALALYGAVLNLMTAGLALVVVLWLAFTWVPATSL